MLPDHRRAAADCAVLIPSWDGYSDLWQPFFYMWHRYWPDCPFQVYLGANEKSFTDSRVKMLHVSVGALFGARVRCLVERLEEPYVLLVLEDFLWRSPTPTPLILEALAALKRHDGHMMRLTNRPAPEVALAGERLFGAIRIGAPYRVSTQATIWRRTTLLELLRDNETIWQFELDGSRRSDTMPDGFFCTWRQIAPYGYHVVERGKWFRHEAFSLTRQGVPCDFTARPVMTRYEALRWRISMMSGRAQAWVPWPYRERLKSALKGLRSPRGGHAHV